jgi:hypothetical protein
MKLFVHPVYGKKIPWLCRLDLHSDYRYFTPFGHEYKCRRCGRDTG